jgi:hypothetical protein
MRDRTLENDDRFLVITLDGVPLALPLRLVAGVITLGADEIRGLKEEGLFQWHGRECRRLSLRYLSVTPQPGHTGVLLDAGQNFEVLVCDAKSTLSRAGRRFAMPRQLASRYPFADEAFSEGDRLVYCLNLEKAALR